MRTRIALLRCAVVVLLGLSFVSGAFAGEVVEFGQLGHVSLYRPADGKAGGLVLLLSGEGGWTPTASRMARHLADQGFLVAGIDSTQFRDHLLNSGDPCLYTAGELEAFAHFIEVQSGFPRYLNPLLVGFSAGATLAYTTLVQSPVGTFKGAVSLGFCPELPWPKPMCRGSGPGLQSTSGTGTGQQFAPAPGIQDPWIVLQGARDTECHGEAIGKFVAAVPAATMVVLPAAEHQYTDEQNYLSQLLAATGRLTALRPPVEANRPASVADLPLVEIAATGKPRDVLAIMLTGDGGWAGLDREVATALAASGIAVVGWDSLRYFWAARTPDVAAHDLGRVIDHYTRAWHKSQVLAIGYSMGADVMPFMVNRLSSEARRKITLTALLAPGEQAFFEFHFGLWLGQMKGGLPIAPEIERLTSGQVLCIFGTDEADSLCRRTRRKNLHPAELPGGHHFDSNYQRVSRTILQAIPD